MSSGLKIHFFNCQDQHAFGIKNATSCVEFVKSHEPHTAGNTRAPTSNRARSIVVNPDMLLTVKDVKPLGFSPDSITNKTVLVATPSATFNSRDHLQRGRDIDPVALTDASMFFSVDTNALMKSAHDFAQGLQPSAETTKDIGKVAQTSLKFLVAYTAGGPVQAAGQIAGEIPGLGPGLMNYLSSSIPGF